MLNPKNLSIFTENIHVNHTDIVCLWMHADRNTFWIRIDAQIEQKMNVNQNWNEKIERKCDVQPSIDGKPKIKSQCRVWNYFSNTHKSKIMHFHADFTWKHWKYEKEANANVKKLRSTRTTRQICKTKQIARASTSNLFVKHYYTCTCMSRHMPNTHSTRKLKNATRTTTPRKRPTVKCNSRSDRPTETCMQLDLFCQIGCNNDWKMIQMKRFQNKSADLQESHWWKIVQYLSQNKMHGSHSTNI